MAVRSRSKSSVSSSFGDDAIGDDAIGVRPMTHARSHVHQPVVCGIAAQWARNVLGAT